jgi:hypothetical protein
MKAKEQKAANTGMVKSSQLAVPSNCGNDPYEAPKAVQIDDRA